jgi:hypothetical protein
MAKAPRPLRKFSEIIDHVERIREEMLALQKSLENIEDDVPARPPARKVKK